MEVMKKIFSILAIATLMSCTPEPVTVDCGCGKIKTKRMLSDKIKNYAYTYECNGQTIGVGSMIDYKIGATICR